MDKYTVFRSDLMSGTDVGAFLASAKFYDADGNEADVENGTIVKLGDYLDGERELRKAVVASSSDDKSKCGVVGTPEIMYDERKKNLSEYINEAGSPIRVYIPESGNMYSVTAEGFVDGNVPTSAGEDSTVGIGTDGKLDISADGWGTVEAIEQAGRYTYYVIRVA